MTGCRVDDVQVGRDHVEVETANGARLAVDDLRAARLARYDVRWRDRLLPEIRTGTWFRRLLVSLSDAKLDRLVEALAADHVQVVIRQSARFNWHRSVILAVIRQPGIKSILLRSLFR